MIKNYVVTGMTDEIGRAAVEEELNEIPGIQGVEVDPASGQVTVTGELISDQLVERAVENAGFSVQQDED
ncbi:MAG: heavy-metal-associated domain-containing protein [Corynebacterium sp.]|uniref:heavy-metal-associated domain-containing protein n=1 Tax=Corynebacterium sp. TaxID=1720 RepID=UPI0026DF1DC5|nr:heavy-metal-associated domain-containing protein [Corynebacterium sp.]MDO5670752.1 heavy-metal-associated domain-containing protein [Corynebacterium sp.]